MNTCRLSLALRAPVTSVPKLERDCPAPTPGSAIPESSRACIHILVFHTTGTNTKVSWTVADRLTHPWSGEGCQMEVMGQQPLVSVVDDDESVRESLPDLLRQC